MRHTIRLLMLFIIMAGLHPVMIDPTQADPLDRKIARFTEVELINIYSPNDKNITTIYVKGKVNILSLDGGGYTELLEGAIISAKTNGTIAITHNITINSDGSFSIAIPHPILKPGSYTDFVTLSLYKENVIVLPETYNLIVTKGTLDVEVESLPALYNSDYYINGTIDPSQINKETNLMRVYLMIADVGPIEGHRIVGSRIDDGQFRIRINQSTFEILDLGSHAMELYIPESEYYGEIRLPFVFQINKGLGSYRINRATGDNIIHYNSSTIQIQLINRFSLVIENASVIMDIEGESFTAMTNVTGWVVFDVRHLIPPLDSIKYQWLDIELKLQASHSRYAFATASYQLRIMRPDVEEKSLWLHNLGIIAHPEWVEAIVGITLFVTVPNLIKRKKVKA